MKRLIIALLTLPMSVIAQTNNNKFVIAGKIGALNAPAKAYLTFSAKGKMTTDSSTLKDGIFEFRGFAPEGPTQAYVSLNKDGSGMNKTRDFVQIYVEPGTISFTSTTGLISDAILGGTQTNIELNAYNKLSRPANELLMKYTEKMQSSTEAERNSPVFKAEKANLLKDIYQMRKTTSLEFIKANSASILSLKLVKDQAYNMDYADFAPLFESLSPSLKSSTDGQAIATLLTKMKAVSIGATAPGFTLPDTTGHQVSLSDFRGKYVLVDFWASWCGPCRAENPNLVRTYQKYKDRNFAILGVSLDRPGDKAKWEAAIQKDGLTWTNVSDLKFWQSEVAQAYGVQAIPQNFLLDPSGKVVAKNLKGETLDTELAQVLTGSK